MAETFTNAEKAKPFQFTLRQLLITVTILACVLACGRWLYVRYLHLVPLTGNDYLGDYVGRRVSISGKVIEKNGKPGESVEPSYFVCFQGAAVYMFLTNNKTPKDGQEIVVTGYLARASTYIYDVAPAVDGKQVTYCLHDATWQ
jgi:hypothetical protein